MDNSLIQDYLNKNSHIIDEKVIVKNSIDYGDFVVVNVEWDSEEATHETTLKITPFDLMCFIYSKIK